ncbi:MULTISPECIES: hypothetical protein [unclassified Sulfitobacter]|uniref:hypothetical protein n=1 Tax=unclassified Sulfitobacter TaxID=196795 RepID=UPI003745FC18
MTKTLPTPRTDSVLFLLDRSFLIRRWQHGSDPFFWRYEKLGRLSSVSDGTKQRYTWDAVFKFEGGLPPEGLRAEYQSHLLTEYQTAGLCSVKPSYILSAARCGDLPCRRIGRAYRFVPIEIEAWQRKRFVNRKTLKKLNNNQDE